jgi:hypothetical protein
MYVLSFIAVILVIVYILVVTSILKDFACQKDFLSNLLSNFIHTDLTHLLSNLYGLYIISRIENKIGPKNFVILLVLITFLNTVFETLLYRVSNVPCAIGFSSIIYGFYLWDIAYFKTKFEYRIIISMLFDIIVGVFNKKLAIVHHLLGMLAGVIVAQFNVLDLRTFSISSESC